MHYFFVKPLHCASQEHLIAAQFCRRGRRPPPHRPLPSCSPISPVRSSSYAWPTILPAHHLQFLSARPAILPAHHLQMHNCDGEVHPRHEKLRRRGAPDMGMGWARTSSELRATTGVLVCYMPPWRCIPRKKISTGKRKIYNSLTILLQAAELRCGQRRSASGLQRGAVACGSCNLRR